MIKHLFILLFILRCVPAGGQSRGYFFSMHHSPVITEEKLSGISHIQQLTPAFWHVLRLSPDERTELNKKMREELANGYTTYPDPNNFNRFLEITCVDISTVHKGKQVTASGSSDLLTASQRDLISAAELGKDLEVNIKFKYVCRTCATEVHPPRIIEGKISVTVIPPVEASYPGGDMALTTYLMQNVIDQIESEYDDNKIGQAILKFIVDEQGRVISPRMNKSTGYIDLDLKIMEAAKRMPLWKPARHTSGAKVKQEISIPFRSGQGC